MKTKSILPVFLILFTAVGSASSLTWNSSSDWDKGVSETGVVHEEVQNTDLNDARELKKGYSAENPLYSSNLVGYWRLDEDSGDTAYDFSGNNYDGTNFGPSQGTTGILDTTAYKFDGDSDYVEAPVLSNLDKGVITVSAWVKSYGPTGSRNSIISISEGDNSCDSSVMAMHEDGGDNIYFWINDGGCGGGGTWVDVSTDAVVDEWIFVTGTYDGEKLRIYVNGELKNTLTNSGSMDTPGGDTGIGARNSDDTHYFNGKIDEVRVYDRALSSSEIQKLYKAGKKKGNLTTDLRNFSKSKNPGNIKLKDAESALNSQDAEVLVESDTDGDNSIEEVSNPVTLNGSGGPYNVSGLSSESKNFRLDIRISTSDVTTTPEISSLNLTAGAGRPAICDTIGPQNECISENKHEVSGENFQVESEFETRETSVFEAFSSKSSIFVSNTSILSGFWTGAFNITADQITIKPGADFRPEGGRIILREN